MKAIAVTPGKRNSIHLQDIPKPAVDDVPEGKGVLVQLLRVGVDGTDKEINDAEYGAAPHPSGAVPSQARGGRRRSRRAPARA